MLGVGGFQPPCNLFSAFATGPQNLTSSLFLISNKTHKTNDFFLHWKICSNNSFFQGRNGFTVSALKKKRKSNRSPMEVEDYDDDGDEEEVEDEDEAFVPFRNLKSWLQNKPSGFGEGKEYDTSIEDKLFEEIEQSKRAQLANINKLKNSPPNPNSKDQQVKRAPEVILSGVRVRVENLPKKKNIHRDLKLAFKESPGILNISPAVSGNKKTRDPICKGFAFIDFKSEEYANRFLQIYSRKSITFGKTQKEITCEMTNPSRSSNSTTEKSPRGANTFTSPLTVPILEEDPDIDSDINNLSSDSMEVTLEEKSAGPENEYVSEKWEENEENIVFIDALERNDDESLRPRTMEMAVSLPLKHKQKNQKILKKQVKKKSVNAPKSIISGSSNRLKIKEKAVLTGVLSKYGAKAASASREER